MDFITLLRRDHEGVSALFKQIQRGFEQPDMSYYPNVVCFGRRHVSSWLPIVTSASRDVSKAWSVASRCSRPTRSGRLVRAHKAIVR